MFSRKSKAVLLSNVNVRRMILESQKSMGLTVSKERHDVGKSLGLCVLHLHVEQDGETCLT